MNLLDVIQHGGQVPKLGSDVVVNSNARDLKNRGQRGWVKGYEMHIVLYDSDREVRVTAKSVDVIH